MNDIDKFRIQALGSVGFSHRFIASLVFNKSSHRVTDNEVRKVQYYLYKENTLVTNWRNGKTTQAMNFANAVQKPKKKRRGKVA